MKLNEYKEKLEETNYDVFVTDSTSDLINYLKSKNEMVRIFINESVPVYLAGMGYETIHLDMIDTANKKGGFRLKYNYKDPKQICLLYVPFTDETFDEEGDAYDDNYTICYGYDKFDMYSEKDFSKFKLYKDLGKCNLTDLNDVYNESLNEDFEQKEFDVNNWNIDDFLHKDIFNHSIYDLIDLTNLEVVDKVQEDGPQFILPNGKILISSGYEDTHQELIETLIIEAFTYIYSYDFYNNDDVFKNLRDYDVLDRFTDIYNLIRINSGTSYVEERCYCVLPKDRPTESQYRQLQNFFDLVYKQNRESILVFLGYDSHEYYTNNIISDDIIKSIKRGYNTGTLYESLEDTSNDKIINESNQHEMLEKTIYSRSIYELLDLAGWNTSENIKTTINTAGPQFILPNGEVFTNNKFKVHEEILEELVYWVWDKLGYNFKDANLYDEDNFLDEFTYAEHLIRINPGTTYSESRFYCVLPEERPTEAQYQTLTDFLDLGIELDKVQVLIFVGDIDSKWYNFFENTPDEIIKKIKRCYTTGSFVEELEEDLSKQQQEFFKDSKVRDKDGNLLVCYHGASNPGFKEFNPKNAKSQFGKYKFGKANVNYFTTDKQSAISYTNLGVERDNNVYACYINIVNPYIVNNETESEIKSAFNIKDKNLRQRQIQLFDKLINKYKWLKLEEDDLDRFNDDLLTLNLEARIDDDYLVIYELGNNSKFGFEQPRYSQYLDDELFIDLDEVEEFRDSVIGEEDDYFFTTDDIVRYVLSLDEDYDGIIIEDIFDSKDMFSGNGTDVITLKSSNQIKLINNENPTSSNRIDEDTNINDIYYRLEIHQKGGLFTNCQDIINKCRGSYSDDEYELGNRLDGLVGQLEYEFKWAPKDLNSKNKYAYTEQEFNRINNLKSYYDEDISVIEDLKQTLSRLGYKLDIIKIKPNKINYKDTQQIAYEKLNESSNSSMTVRLLTRQSQQVKDILKSGTVYRASYSLSNQQLTKQYKALADYFGFKSCPIFCIPENYSNVFIKDGVVGAFGLTDNQINSNPIILDVPVNEVRMMEFYDWCAFMHYTEDTKYDDVFEYTREEALNHIDDYLGNISTQIIDGKVYGYKYPQVIIDEIRPEWVVKESLDESLLLEKTRNQLLTKSKTADNYSPKNQTKGKNRFERRKYSRIARSVAQYNEISMDDLFKKDNLQVGIQVQGETNNYIVQLRFEGVIRELAEEVKRNNGKLEFKNIIKAMSKVFNNGDVFINCSCPDYKYRQSYWATKQGYSIVPELRPSDITNPKDSKGGGCKHILLVLANLDWVMKISSVINNYIKYCQKNLQNVYATYIFPKVYGMPYQKAVQLSLFDDGLLPDDQETLSKVASQNIKNKNKSNLKKPEPIQKGFNKKEEPVEEPVQKTKSKTTGKSPLSTTDKYRYERDKNKEPKFTKQTSLFDIDSEEQ